MDTQKEWEKFIISGSVTDYLNFVNSRGFGEISEGNRNTLYNPRVGNKGTECRGE